MYGVFIKKLLAAGVRIGSMEVAIEKLLTASEPFLKQSQDLEDVHRQAKLVLAQSADFLKTE